MVFYVFLYYMYRMFLLLRITKVRKITFEFTLTEINNFNQWFFNFIYNFEVE